MALRTPKCKMVQNVSRIRLFKSSKCPDRRENIMFAFHPWVFLHFRSFMSIVWSLHSAAQTSATEPLISSSSSPHGQGRIKKIMQKDTEVGRIATAVPVIICILSKHPMLNTGGESFVVKSHLRVDSYEACKNSFRVLFIKKKGKKDRKKNV